MNRLAFGALAIGLATASCTHGGSSGILPSTGMSSQSAAVEGGTGNTRRATTALTVPSGWAATSTLPLALSGASSMGALSSTQSITVRVGLQLNNVAALKAAIQSGQTISPSAFASTYGPTAAQVSQVESYLQSQGLTSVTAEPNNLIISATGTAAQVESAFDTKLESYSLNGATVYANTTPALVPASLSGIVVAVLGLNNVQAMTMDTHKGATQPTPEPTPAGTPESPCSLYGLEILAAPTPLPEPASSEVGCLRNYRPADYWRAYDIGNTPTANGISVAIMTAGGLGSAVSDFRTNEQGDGIPQVPVIVKQVGIPGAEISGGPDEWTLDMSASSGMAGVVKTIYVYNAIDLDDSDVVLMFSRWATDDLARAGNSSFGGCEAFPYLDGSMLLADEVFMEGAVQGQTMFASTGDTGSFCPVEVGENGVPAGAPLVNWPAASSYVVAVGGTTMLTDNAGVYQGEAAWYSTGGGTSQFEYQPYWEATVQRISGDRGIPDVAMDGDLQTGMIIYLSDSGGWTVIGGTSLSSPLMMGTWARMLQAHRNLGYAPPLLYNDFDSNTAGSTQIGPPPWIPQGAFHNIIVGCDGLYCAAPGYNYVSGLGSIDVSLLEAQL